MKIEIVDEPPRTKGSNKRNPIYVEVRKAAIDNPGKWVKIPDLGTTSAARIREGGLGFSPMGHFDATSRNVKKNRGDVYVTYIGPSEETP